MPATRARTSTSREPAVCPTYSNVTGSACGATVTTVTSGGGMPAPGPPLWPPLSGAPFEGLQAAPVRGIVYTPDQLVGLEAVDELGDVGSHAGAARGQLAKRHRLAGLHQLGQGGELGARQLHLRQGLFELALDRMRRLYQRPHDVVRSRDRKSTRLNSSHSQISYAVFCLKKKKKNQYSSQYA